MFYRIRITLAFDDEDACEDILDKALDHFLEARTINPGQENEEKSFIIIEKCYHDQEPHVPCTLIREYFTD